MRYLLFVYVTLYIIRPSEWIPGLLGTPLLFLLSIVILAIMMFSVATGQSPNLLSGDEEKMMIGFIVAICFSHISHAYVGGVIDSVNNFLPCVIGFFLFLASVKNMKQFDIFIMLLIILISFVAYEGIKQYTSGFAHGGLEPILQITESFDGEQGKLTRIRWYGVFNDPNDLGLLLILTIPFLINMLLNRHFFLSLVAFPLIGIALYYTNSRGSILAAVVTIMSYFIFRFKSKKGAFLGAILALLIIVVGPSRTGSISAEEESAQGRVEAWYEAYQMLKSNPLFGVGQGMFTDYHSLTAHNSFVLVMAELGVTGLFFFTGLLYYPYNWLWNYLVNPKYLDISKADLGVVSAIYGSLTGVLVSMFFLSRAFVLIPYLSIAMAIYIKRYIDTQYISWDGVLLKNKTHIKNIAFITLGQIVLLNIIVKLLL
jgi:O-antigen ligase